jgi:zinc protease
VPGRAFPFPVHASHLANGLRLVVIPVDSPGLVAYHSVVRVGSRNEVEPGKSGFAHFFEHMMFRGTPRYPTEKYNDALKALGADSNAYTSDDVTVYHILAGKAGLPTIVELEADRFQNLAYSEPDFQKEARAVLGEYNKGASDPMQKIFETLYDAAFVTHTYKHTTIGFLRDIEDMPNQFAYSRQFFDRYYRPDNVVIVVAGDVTPDGVRPLVEAHYRSWKKGPPRPAVPREPPQTAEKRVRLGWKSPTLPIWVAGFHAPAFSTADPDVPALDVLAALLFSERARLYKRLVLEQQKVESLWGGLEARVDPNLFLAGARVKDARDVPAVERAVTDEIARIAREGVDARTLAEVLSHSRYAFAARLSTADNVAGVAAEFIGLAGRLEAIEDHFARLAEVTTADVVRVAKTHFARENRTVVTLADGKP